MHSTIKTLLSSVSLALVLCPSAAANLITNGGFEAGLSNWTAVDQVGSEGSFVPQTGTTSPEGLFTVPLPPEGSTSAMTGAQAPGSHILYQDFLVPSVVPGAVMRFSLFVGNRADAFYTPDLLDFATPELNQQARVDIVNPAADPFSAAPADIFLNLFQTSTADPLVSGYKTYSVDVTPLFQANAGQTLRLRFAQMDNVNIFQFGVDNVSAQLVPEPGTWALTLTALLGLAIRRLRR